MMIENKRFIITQDFEEHHRQIRDNGHIIMGCFIEPQAEVIVDLLNELNDENKELRIQYNFIREQSNEFHRIARENANQVGQLEKENNKLKELLNLIAEAQSVKKEESVKEILRNEIKAIDTVTDESAQAWNDYCILCNFFEEQYNEKV